MDNVIKENIELIEDEMNSLFDKLNNLKELVRKHNVERIKTAPELTLLELRVRYYQQRSVSDFWQAQFRAMVDHNQYLEVKQTAPKITQ